MSAKRRDRFDEDYSPSQAVQSRQLLNGQADKLAVVFPPWHGGRRVTEALVKRLQKNNWAVLNYTFHDQILEPDIERVSQSFEAIQTEVTDNLGQINEMGQYSRVDLIGVSLGNVAMALVAEKNPEFTSATLVVPGSNLALAMWHGTRTQNIRNHLSQQGINEIDLDDAWRNLAPMSHAKAFKEKPTELVISTKDCIIPTSFQYEMSEALNDARSRVTNHYNRLGHAASVAMFCYKGGKI